MSTRQPPAKAPTGKQAPVPPNQTLYVWNVPSTKIQKADLKTALYMLFSTYGPVLDVVCMRTVKMRGQAHVVFRDLQAATQAMRSLEGFVFLGQALKIQYARGKSDVISRLDGSYNNPEKSGAETNVEMTATQQSIFNAPAPGTAAANAPSTARGLPAKPPAAPPAAPSAEEARGQKRARDEEDEEEDSDGDVAMEEESDSDDE
ncbi:U2 snRNP complex subunit msl1 [Pestalotiopsis sp. 9143b]|nr:U2 snRNP complex subunit msl1 [Pestalotiopsis sp. 9143b]